MIENLVIVESPAKAKTIEKFLGKSFQVKSSYGHIRDLAKKNLGIDIDNGFSPHYEISSDKKKVVSELKKLVKQTKTVWLASDEDREGEAIAWHLYDVLGLSDDNTKRIVFHEITKEAISNAIENPRTIDKNLVDAQQARRILDRIVGFEISPVLWRKVKPSLSAGRVQSVSVRLIVEREREIIAFKSTSSYKVAADFLVDEQGTKLHAELKEKLPNAKLAEEFLTECRSSDFTIGAVEKKPAKKSPSAPFTTSTLQQEASRKLGYSVSQTMSVAQRLYEAGFITYMRTDSVNLSGAALKAAKQEIIKNFGEEYSKTRTYKTKAKGAQEAHEAIRPSYMDRRYVSDTHQEQQLYDLIWKRTVASQMADAKLEKTTVSISISESDKHFTANGEVLKFDGFLKLYIESTDDEKEPKENTQSLLPPLTIGQQLEYDSITATERFTHHPPRYTEASLVRKLEELGIGRPSTYAPIISTIQQRGYVVKESRDGVQREYTQVSLKNSNIKHAVKTENTGAEKQKLFPTDIGMVVNDFLVKYFKDIVDFNFTASVEKDFDEIANGKIVWNKMISEFYSPFHKNVETTLETSEREQGERLLGNDPESGKPVYVRIGRFGPMVQLGESNDEDKPAFASLGREQFMETIKLEEALERLKKSNEGRYLGEDPKTGKKIVARIGRFGPMVQLGDSEGDEKPQYASLKKGQTIDNITFEDALELFKLPRKIGVYEEKDVIAAVGRFGPYLKFGDLFVSLKKDMDPLTVEMDTAIELIEAKKEAELKKIIKLFPDNPKVKIVKDRWGNPTVYYKKKYVRLSTKVKPEELTAEQSIAIAEEGIKAKANKKKK